MFRSVGPEKKWSETAAGIFNLDQRKKNFPLEPQTTIKKWMFGETTTSYVKIGNHPIETTIYKWSFGVPGQSVFFSQRFQLTVGLKASNF